MIDWAEHKFIALYTNNGHPEGFNQTLAFSKEICLIDLNAIPLGKWTIPIIAYELKNRFEHLKSPDKACFSLKDAYFVMPEGVLENFSLDEFVNKKKVEFDFSGIQIHSRVSKENYLEQVNKLINHIRKGNIYEINYCIEFFVENIEVDPFALFLQYNKSAMAPMSGYLKLDNIHILCASPERFLKRNGNRLISQPIKGTRKRFHDNEKDKIAIKELKSDIKERAENIMIVDLVRNDLSKIAQPNSVKVDELCEVYSFNTVHQSISTVSCDLSSSVNFETILKATFPMGSMTGAPKVRAMQLIDELEENQRQFYSGSMGYIKPNGDFDLNVIIRTMVYDQKKKYLSFMVGSAITAECSPEKEYEECMLKAEAMLKLFK